MEVTTPRERPSNAWIRPSIWSLIDEKAALSCTGRINQRSRRKLVRKIKSSLQDERRHQTAAVGAKIVGLLGAGELTEVWISLKDWYTATADQPPKPCHKTTEKQTATRVELYEKVPLPGDLILINVEPKDVPYACPGEVELRDVVRGLRNGRAGNTRKLRAETINAWLLGAEREEREPEGNAGAGDTWRTFTSLIRVIWETGVTLQQILWTVVASALW